MDDRYIVALIKQRFLNFHQVSGIRKKNWNLTKRFIVQDDLVCASLLQAYRNKQFRLCATDEKKSLIENSNMRVIVCVAPVIHSKAFINTKWITMQAFFALAVEYSCRGLR